MNLEVFLEVGAGKGLLGLAVAIVQPSGRFIFLEKAGSRKKVDRYFRDNNIVYQRIVMDIRHCYLPKLPFIISQESADHSTVGSDNAIIDNNEVKESDEKKKSVTVLAKHLCGAATDLTLSGLRYLCKDSKSLSVHFCIATCCHHVCNYEDYVGKSWYHSQGFLAAEFPILRSWSSWFSGDPNRVTVSELNQSSSNSSNSSSGSSSSSSSKYGNSSSTKRNRSFLSVADNPSSTDSIASNPSNVDPLKAENDLTDQVQEGSPADEVADDTDNFHHAPSGGRGLGVPRPESLSKEDMAQLGMKIKRILDYGRVLFARDELHLDAEMIVYCDSKLSPENHAIITRKQEGDS